MSRTVAPATKTRHSLGPLLVLVLAGLITLAPALPTAADTPAPGSSPGQAAAEQAAPQANDDLLTDQWWDEPSHGLRLRVPADIRQFTHTSDGSLVQFVHRDGFRISVSITRSEQALDLKAMKALAIDQFSFAYPSWTQVNENIAAPPRMRGAGIILAAVDDQKKSLIWGQVYILIDDYNFITLQLNAETAAYEQAVKTLEQLIGSLHLMNPMALNEKRAAHIKAGVAWRQKLAEQPVQQAPAEQWFRIVEKGQDVGWEWVRIITDPEALKAEGLEPGTVIKVQTQVAVGDRIFDTAHNVYESTDKDLEIWEVATTLRRTVNGVERTATWSDTGFRTDAAIRVTRDEPAKAGATSTRVANPITDQQKQWPKPPVGYVSQVDLHRLAHAWHTIDGEASFYAYDVNSGSLAQRHYTVTQTPEGQTAVYIRPTPNSPLQRIIYDQKGQLRQREMSDGRVFIATTADQIARIWKIRR